MGQAIAFQAPLFKRSRIAAKTVPPDTARNTAPDTGRATQPAAYQARWLAPRSVKTSLSSARTNTNTTRPRDERLMMQVVLDDVFLSTLRRALFSASEGLITLLRVQPDPRDAHRVKVWLGMNRPSVRAVIDLIIATLPAAEIGRIAPA